MANPWFYDPEVKTWADSMEWVDYLDDLMNSQQTDSVVNNEVSEEREQLIKDDVEIEQTVSDEKADEQPEEETLSVSAENDQLSEEKDEVLEQDDEDELIELDDEDEDEEYSEDDEDEEDDEEDELSEEENPSASVNYYWIPVEKDAPAKKGDEIKLKDSDKKENESPKKKKSFWSFLTGNRQPAEDLTDTYFNGKYRIYYFYDTDKKIDYKPAEMGAQESKLIINGNHFDIELYFNGEQVIKASGTFSAKKTSDIMLAKYELVLFANQSKIGNADFYKDYGRKELYIVIRKFGQYVVCFRNY